MVRLTGHLDMTIAVDWDLKPQPKETHLCSKTHSQIDLRLVFKTNYCLMQVESIAECSKGSILQYFRPSLSDNWSLRSLFSLFLSGSFTLVLLYLTLSVFHLLKCYVYGIIRLKINLDSFTGRFDNLV